MVILGHVEKISFLCLAILYFSIFSHKWLLGLETNLGKPSPIQDYYKNCPKIPLVNCGSIHFKSLICPGFGCEAHVQLGFFPRCLPNCQHSLLGNSSLPH